jgi:uncharacterized alpha-E superfamily protein
MPILPSQRDIFPESLLDESDAFAASALQAPLPGHAGAADHDAAVNGHGWIAFYTLSRREKDLMRKLEAASIPFSYEAYQRLYISRVEPERVVEFLLTNPDFPHSVRFCLSRILQSLTEISGRLPDRCDDEVVRTVGRLLNDLVYLDGASLDGERLHSFLGNSLTRCARIGKLLQQQYALQ